MTGEQSHDMALPPSAVTESGQPLGPAEIPLDVLIAPADIMKFSVSVAELTQMESSVLLYDPLHPRPVSSGMPIQTVRAPICLQLNEVMKDGTAQCVLDVHSAAHRAMCEGKPITADCIGGSGTLFACPILLRHGTKTYPKAAIVAAAHDIYNFHFADRLAELTGKSTVATEEVMCQTDKRCLNAAQLRLLRAVMTGQAESFSGQISDRYAQLGYLATIVSQKEELGRAYDQLDGEFKAVGALQRALVPREPPTLRGYKIATHYLPARRAGGDYYDFLPQATGPCAVLVADVSGHGPGAAVVMAMMRAILHTFPTNIVLPEPVMKYLNDHLCRSIMHDQFATAFFGLFGAEGRILAVSAGHEPPLLFEHQTGEVRAIENDGGFPLGVVSDIRLARANFDMRSGDVLMIYTDGITDVRNPSGERFGLDRLTGVLRAKADIGAAAVRDAVVREVMQMSAGHPPDDDQTLVVIERA